jgi:hypothetical protein
MNELDKLIADLKAKGASDEEILAAVFDFQQAEKSSRAPIVITAKQSLKPSDILKGGAAALVSSVPVLGPVVERAAKPVREAKTRFKEGGSLYKDLANLTDLVGGVAGMGSLQTALSGRVFPAVLSRLAKIGKPAELAGKAATVAAEATRAPVTATTAQKAAHLVSRTPRYVQDVLAGTVAGAAYGLHEGLRPENELGTIPRRVAESAALGGALTGAVVPDQLSARGLLLPLLGGGAAVQAFGANPVVAAAGMLLGQAVGSRLPRSQATATKEAANLVAKQLQAVGITPEEVAATVRQIASLGPTSAQQARPIAGMKEVAKEVAKLGLSGDRSLPRTYEAVLDDLRAARREIGQQMEEIYSRVEPNRVFTKRLLELPPNEKRQVVDALLAKSPSFAEELLRSPAYRAAAKRLGKDPEVLDPAVVMAINKNTPFANLPPMDLRSFDIVYRTATRPIRTLADKKYKSVSDILSQSKTPERLDFARRLHTTMERHAPDLLAAKQDYSGVSSVLREIEVATGARQPKQLSRTTFPTKPFGTDIPPGADMPLSDSWRRAVANLIGHLGLSRTGQIAADATRRLMQPGPAGEEFLQAISRASQAHGPLPPGTGAGMLLPSTWAKALTTRQQLGNILTPLTYRQLLQQRED